MAGKRVLILDDCQVESVLKEHAWSEFLNDDDDVEIALCFRTGNIGKVVSAHRPHRRIIVVTWTLLSNFSSLLLSVVFNARIKPVDRRRKGSAIPIGRSSNDRDTVDGEEEFVSEHKSVPWKHKKKYSFEKDYLIKYIFCYVFVVQIQQDFEEIDFQYLLMMFEF